jgi:hypothetical protein
MQRRFDFVVDEIGPNGFYGHMYNRIHVDEKWFFLTTDGKQYYLSKENPIPHQSIGHKSHIPKVMLLCAVARCQFDANGNCIFDGKIGMWPSFAVQVAALRRSQNREAGILEWKCVSVTKEVYQRVIIDKLIPAIVEKWPLQRYGHPIRVQQQRCTFHQTTPNSLLRWPKPI